MTTAPPQPPQSDNATITVTYRGRQRTITLDGTELSVGSRREDGTFHRYLSTASRDYVSTEVEKALIALAQEAS